MYPQVNELSFFRWKYIKLNLTINFVAEPLESGAMCPLCRSLFIGPCTPKKLPCGHTVCIKCLNKYAELHDSKCVLCSRPYGVQPCELPTDLEIQRTAKEFDEANDKIGQKEKEPEKEKSKYNL